MPGNFILILYFKQKTFTSMTILQLIITACIAKGVPEKYAERIQKAFKIEKAEGLETFVDMFKENVLPAITEAEQTAGQTAQAAAVAEFAAQQKQLGDLTTLVTV